MGGLFLLKELRKQFPKQSFIYLADKAHFPYGEKTPDFLRSLIKENIRFLAEQGAQQVILACNTASAFLEEPKMHPVPVKEVISASLKQAHKVSLNKKAGLLATKATVNSGVFPKTAQKLKMDLQIHQRACPLLAPFVEQGGWISPPQRKTPQKPALDHAQKKENIQFHYIEGHPLHIPNKHNISSSEKNKTKTPNKLFPLLEEYLKPLLNKGVDTIILGCTHYLYLKPFIEQYLENKKTAVVGPVEFLTQDLKKDRNMPAKDNRVLPAPLRFFISGGINREFEKQCLEIWSSLIIKSKNEDQ